MVLALGVTLMITGMVTHWVISLLGVVLAVRSVVGWFFEVLPHEHHAPVPIQRTRLSSPAPAPRTARLPIDARHRKADARRNIQRHGRNQGRHRGRNCHGGSGDSLQPAPYHSLWYAVNLLAAGGFVSWAGQSDAFLAQFHLMGLLAALGIHALTSVLIGLLYGAMLPMFPRRPILTAGFIAPLLWTGILYTALGVISPILNERIDWLWFVVSQIAFGLVCGFVVNLQVKVRTPQFQSLPFSVRAGLHGDQESSEDRKQ